MRKIIGLMCAVFMGLLVLLTGCPVEVAPESGEDYIAAAVLINEKAKYVTAVTFYTDEIEELKEVTGRFIQLVPGKSANKEVSVSVSDAGEGNLFISLDGRIYFTGEQAPKEVDDEGEYIPHRETVTLSFGKDGETAVLDVLAVIKDRNEEKPDDERVAISDEDTFLLFGYDVIKGSYINRRAVKITRPILDIDKVNAADLGRRAASTLSEWEYAAGDSVKAVHQNFYGSMIDTNISNSISSTVASVMSKGAAPAISRSIFSGIFESIKGKIVGALGTIAGIGSVVDITGDDMASNIINAVQGVVFAGGVEKEFSPTQTTSKGTSGQPATLETSYYVKAQGYHVTKEEWLRKTQPSVLATLLDDSFQTDVNTKSAAYILDSYGTHLIVRCQWGGRAEFNYSYAGTQLATASIEEVKGSLQAAMQVLSGEGSKVSSADKAKAEDLGKNSYITISSRGGNNTGFTTVEQFMAGYADWVASITGKPDLCGISGEDSLIPIWDIVAEINPGKAEEIEVEFIVRTAKRAITLEDFVAAKNTAIETVSDMVILTPASALTIGDKPSSSTTSYMFITAIGILQHKGTGFPAGYNNPFGYNTLVLDSEPGSGYRITDANDGFGAMPIQIYYKRENSHLFAIAELRIVDQTWRLRAALQAALDPKYSDKQWITATGSPPDGDLNYKVGQPLYLQYRMATKADTTVITSIESYPSNYKLTLDDQSKWEKAGKPDTGWAEWVKDFDGAGPVNLNKDTVGGTVRYLAVRKVPYTW
ncbi:MAG: hypothetical protein LBD44_06195 [Spirochaetaceae bacterium]|nr:hypothetical protein [Spirochaetaceae bacterium]